MKLYDVRAIARFLDVSERRVRQLRDEKVIAEVRPGLYDLIDTNHRYINYLRKRNPEGDETHRLQHGAGEAGSGEAQKRRVRIAVERKSASRGGGHRSRL